MQDLEGLRTLLQSPKKIIITSHHKPDADALGSSLAWNAFLQKLGHSTSVIMPTDYPSFLFWMKGNEQVIIYEGNESICEEKIKQADLIFCLDFNTLSRINQLGVCVGNAHATKIMIDHHLEPSDFASLRFSNIKAAATAQLIFQIIVALGHKDKIDTAIGECIYAGIMTDTGSFRHSSTNKEVHMIAAELIDIGVDTSLIHQLIYDNNSEIRLRFLGFALYEKLVIKKEYYTAYIFISEEELLRFDSKTGDTEGLVNFALSLEGIHMAACIIQRKDGIKISFRSKGDFSVNQFARDHFDGGGHRNAAGGRSDLSLSETVEKFTNLLPHYKEALSKSYNA